MARKKQITIWSFDLKQERVTPEPTACSECGWALDHPREFHPYAACLMFKGAGNDSGVARPNLDFVIAKAREAGARDAK